MNYRFVKNEVLSSRRTASFWLAAGLIAAMAGVVCLYNLGNSKALHQHEVFVAQPAREMLASGDWLVPRLGGSPRLTKPPLAYWIVAGISSLVGEVNAWTTRLPSAIAGLALVGLMGYWGSKWYGRRTGLCIALVQSTSVYFIIQSRLGKVDMVFGFLTALSLYLAAGYQPNETRRRALYRWIAFYSLVGLTVLCKGPLGPALIFGPLLAFFLLRRKDRFSETLAPLQGISPCPCVMEDFQGVMAALFLRFTGHVQGDSIDDLLLGTDPVNGLLHFTMTTVAPFDSV